MEKKNFYLKKEQVEGLNILSEKTGAKPSELIRRAIDRYLKEELKKK